LALASGGVALWLHGLVAGGGEEGALRASGALAAGLLGACWGIWRGRGAAWLQGDLTRAQRLSERLAELGLGIGEALVRLPLFLARGAGVVVWRGIGDGLIDVLLVGTAYKFIEGVGIALRLLQNGRIQRYTLVAIAAAAALVATMAK
jgi:hypothetical protein